MLSWIFEVLVAVAVMLAVAPPAQPAPVAAPAAVSDVDAYLAQVRPILVRLGEGGDSMAALMAAPAISDPQWREDANAAFDAIQAAHAALVEVQPSPVMRK